jgi:protein-S-isoprenylcysteine O-methyltransferase Ste14
MMGRLASAAMFVALSYFVPLWGRWDLFGDLRPMLAILVAFVIVAGQPTLRREEVRESREADRGTAPLIMLASLGTQIATVVEWRLRVRPVELAPGPITVLGAVIAFAGLALRLHAIRVLGRRFSATVRVTRDHELIDEGAYRYLRHPSYLGVLLVIVGIAVMFRSWLAAAAGVPLMVAVYRRRIRLEERALEATLGAVYRTYRERTWSLLPGIW